MGFSWGSNDSPTYSDYPDPRYARDWYAGRPSPPWPPSGRPTGVYVTCLGCPRHQSRCADCPVDRWEGRITGPNPAYAAPEHKGLLSRLWRRLRGVQ